MSGLLDEFKDEMELPTKQDAEGSEDINDLLDIKEQTQDDKEIQLLLEKDKGSVDISMKEKGYSVGADALVFLFDSFLKLGIPFYIYVKHQERVSKILVKKYLALDTDESKALKKAFELVLAKYQILDNLDPTLNLVIISASIIGTRVTTGVSSIMQEIKHKAEVDDLKKEVAELQKQLGAKAKVAKKVEEKEEEPEEKKPEILLPKIATKPRTRTPRAKKE